MHIRCLFTHMKKSEAVLEIFFLEALKFLFWFHFATIYMVEIDQNQNSETSNLSKESSIV